MQKRGITMDFIQTKGIVYSVKHGDKWFGVDYNMNLYRGCCHGCIYCDSRSDCYHVENFDQVRAKENSKEILYQQLSHKRKKGVVGIGAMSDTYNPFEETYNITREALKVLRDLHFGVCIESKSDLILRDIDILKQIHQDSPTIIKLTVTTTNDELARIIEPNAPSSSKRLAAIAKMASEGLYAGVLMMPILPFINDSPQEIINLVKAAYDANASFIYPAFGVTLRSNQRDYYFEQLDIKFPGLKQRYRERYGDQYSCESPNAKQLYRVFKEECERYHIPYRMRDIINGYKQPFLKEQLSLF